MGIRKGGSDRRGGFIKYLLLAIVVALIGAGIYAYTIFGYIFGPTIADGGRLYIYEDATVEQVGDSLLSKGFVKDLKAYNWVANKKKYSDKIKAGSYLIEESGSMNDLLNKLISGNQDPIKINFNGTRSRKGIALVLARQIMADSTAIADCLYNDSIIKSYGYEQHTFSSMFIPNLYEVYWNITPEQFVSRMHSEYKAFWNEDRKAKAEALNLTQLEVSTLASIVRGETNYKPEMPTVAAVYLLRMKRGIKLQSDPTVAYILRERGQTVYRILRKDLKIDDPYNTYLYSGLPPGPINVPESFYIDAVLNYDKKSRYIYFCAKEDFSGAHNFAVSYSQHLKNARKFHRAMDKAGKKR